MTPRPIRLADRDYGLLLHVYGLSKGHRCGECANVRRVQHGASSSYKCSKARVSSSAATDWRSGWQACGLFKETE